MDAIAAWIETIVEAWVGGLEESGYAGIFILMTIESSFIPFPSEVVMIPAGALAREGRMNVYLAILAGTAGSLTGALVNYYLARYLGLGFLRRFGKYFLINPESLDRAEREWVQHGELTTFVCRLLPGIRQLISLPAGLARMNLARFCLWTMLGAGLWVTILTVAGYWLGPKATDFWEQNKRSITIGLIAIVACIVAIYVWRKLARRNTASPAPAVDPPAH